MIVFLSLRKRLINLWTSPTSTLITKVISTSDFLFIEKIVYFREAIKAFYVGIYFSNKENSEKHTVSFLKKNITQLRLALHQRLLKSAVYESSGL